LIQWFTVGGGLQNIPSKGFTAKIVFLKGLDPALSLGLFLAVLSLVDWWELLCQGYLVFFVWVRGGGGLTGVFAGF
jgi:hypothetical protein